MVSDYAEFLQGKRLSVPTVGFDVPLDRLHPALFPFQRAIVHWALKRGRAAIFADTGLGKTLMQLEWARHVQSHIPRDWKVLIIAPLCVSQQTVREGAKIGIEVRYVRSHPKEGGVYVTNYEMLEHFDIGEFQGIVLDESSILKHLGSKTRGELIAKCQRTPYRLSCTATPAPNDYMEFGGQCEFLGVMKTAEMLAMFFTHDGGNTSQWRLKGHGKAKFWEWLASWAVYVKKPSDIGFDDTGYDLPAPMFHEHIVDSQTLEGMLFPVEAQSLLERNQARRESVENRVQRCADFVNASDEQWVIWCHLNDESRMLESAIAGAVAVEGADSLEKKEAALTGFVDGTVRVLVTKPSIAGFGLNWQHCHNVAFVGLSDSYEQFYQAMRRCWRFGQTQQVNVHIIAAESEGAVLQNIHDKERKAEHTQKEMASHMNEFTRKEIAGQTRNEAAYIREKMEGANWTLHLADCVELASEIESNSIGFTVFSPPFLSLYTYSNSERDMGNGKTDQEFWGHFKFLVKELYRVTMPGRSVSFHCTNPPAMKERDGFIGIKDFRGDMIRMFEAAGFIYHSEVCIWKDPVTAMQRTKALGLLHKTIRKDSAMSRMGIPDYVVTMRKPGENPVPIDHDPADFPVSLWQKIASPIWMDINPSNTLNRDGARDDDDERHIAPLQLDVIERCLMLWSKEGDLVFSPFAGIGSEGYMALKMGRRFIGSELKPSYYRLAIRNLEAAKTQQVDIFSAGD